VKHYNQQDDVTRKQLEMLKSLITR